MKKVLVSSLLILPLFFAGKFYWQNLRGIGPAISKPTTDISQLIEAKPGENTIGFPLKLPPGFSISIYAKSLNNPRDLREISYVFGGGILVSLPNEGKVIVMQPNLPQPPKEKIFEIVSGMNKPHGLEIKCYFTNNGHSVLPCSLYVAATDGVYLFDYYSNPPRVEKQRKIVDLPPGSTHFTRSILITSDDKLLVSVGSSCNICKESDDLRASILIADLDGNNVRHYATGLRNSVFMVQHPKTGDIWATEMGRDQIGDDIPPDEINIIEPDKNYGWPYCYGKQVVDPFNKNQKDCSKTEPAYIDLRAHSAPLGLAFVPDSWPEEYRHDLLVAYHGSWNRTQPTGYKIVRIPLNEDGQVEGKTQDFITGWINDKNEVLGRPVDIFIRPDGSTLISDDKAGVIYLLQSLL